MTASAPTVLLVVLSIAATITAGTTPTAAKTDDTVLRIQHHHLGEHNACCAGDNIVNERAVCMTGRSSAGALDCEQRYMLEPELYPEDEFRSSQHGLETGDILIENGKFCHTNKLNGTGANGTTSLVAMACFVESKQKSMFLLKGLLSLFSVLFILATLYVYYLIVDLRETTDKATCIALGCLLVFLLLLGVMQVVPVGALGAFCVPMGFTVYFFTLAYFSWLNVIMWNVWKTSIMPKWKINEQTWYWLNHVYGWSVPLAMTANLFVHRDTHIAPLSCWLERSSSIFFLYIPMAGILFVNVVLFFWSAWGIHASGMDVSPDRKRAVAYKIRLYLKLITLAGLTWIFELLSFYYGTNDRYTIWLLPDVLNSLHGLGVFLVLVVGRRRVRKELAGKRILGCCTAPAAWANADADSEEGGLHEDDKGTYGPINK